MKRLPIQVLHDQVVDAILLADVVEGADVRMCELRDRAGLTIEAFAELRIGSERLRKDFDRDRAIEPRVAGFVYLADLLEAQRNADKNGSAFFLGGYFKALRERDYEATERQLDAMSTDTRLRVLVPELTWRSGLSDREAKRVLALARDGGVDAGAFRVFAFGGVIRNLSEPVFLEWIDFLIKTNTSVSVGTAVDLCHAVGGSWLAISVEVRSLRSSRTSSRSRRSASVICSVSSHRVPH